MALLGSCTMRQTPNPIPPDHRDGYTLGGIALFALLPPLFVVALSVPTLVLAAGLGALTALLAGRVTDRVRSIRESVGGTVGRTGAAKARPSE